MFTAFFSIYKPLSSCLQCRDESLHLFCTSRVEKGKLTLKESMSVFFFCDTRSDSDKSIKTHLPHTSVLTKKCVIANGAWLGEGVELVQPFSGDVKLQQAGLLHISQSHHLLPFSHRFLTTFPASVQEKHSQQQHFE